MSDAPLCLIAAGGTGGHMFPAQALAEVLLSRGWRVQLSTDARGARYTGGFPDPVEIREVSSATFARGGVLAKALVAPRILAGIGAAALAMLRARPDVVVGFGGYPAIPATAAAWALRVPRMIHEQNGVLGRVNQAFAKRVDQVACGTWPTALPAGVEGIHIGNPVRAAVLDRAAAPYIPPGEYPMRLIVIGGSQGARILSDVVPKGISELPDRILSQLTVTHQAREEDGDAVRAAYAAMGVRAEVMPFIHDLPAQLAEAQLVISRAGASSVADLTVIGRPAILVPLAAAIRDEQTANARGMVDAGAAILMPEAAFTSTSLADAIVRVLDNPDGAMQMSLAALSIGKPDAARDLANLVETLARRPAL